MGKADGKDKVEELTKVHHSISISEDGKVLKSYLCLTKLLSTNVSLQRKIFVPVPEGERVNNPSLDQNEGW